MRKCVASREANVSSDKESRSNMFRAQLFSNLFLRSTISFHADALCIPLYSNYVSYFSRSRSFRYTEAERGRKKNSVIILGNETFPSVFHQGWIFLFRVLTRECTENSLCSAFLLCMIYSVNDCAVKSIKIAPRHKLLTLNYFAKNLPMGRPFQKIQRTWCKGNG